MYNNTKSRGHWVRKVGRAANRPGDEERRGKMPERATVELVSKHK